MVEVNVPPLLELDELHHPPHPELELLDELDELELDELLLEFEVELESFSENQASTSGWWSPEFKVYIGERLFVKLKSRLVLVPWNHTEVVSKVLGRVTWIW